MVFGWWSIIVRFLQPIGWAAVGIFLLLPIGVSSRLLGVGFLGQLALAHLAILGLSLTILEQKILDKVAVIDFANILGVVGPINGIEILRIDR